MQESAERDPYRILLNMTWFRGMFHIYEIVQEIEGTADGRVYVVRKQLLSHGLMHFMRGVDQDEKYTEVRVTRDDLVHVYDTLRHTSVPAYRTAGVGKDGSWYALQIGTRPLLASACFLAAALAASEGTRNF